MSLLNLTQIIKGAVHKVRHAIFGQVLPPSPCHTLSHIPGPPKVRHASWTPPIFSRPSTRNPDKILSQLFMGVFCPGVCQVVFCCLEGFVWSGFCPFPLLPECMLQQKFKHHFEFHISYMYDKKIYKCDVTCPLPPPLCHKLSHLLGPPPPLERA